LDHGGAVWHVTCRGNEKREIFRDGVDRRNLLELFGRVVGILRWRIHAYVLMGNHYHLLLETPEPNLSRGMRQLNGIYTQRFNRRHERAGHLFEGRFKSILVEKEAHLLELIRYVVLNPVRAGIVPGPEPRDWSNYLATAGLARAPGWLEVEWTLAQFGGGPLAGDLYRQFVEAGMREPRTPWVNLRKQVFLGGDGFQRRVQARINSSAPSEEVPWGDRHCVRPTFDQIVRAAIAEFGCDPGLLLQKRRSELRMAVAYLARHEAGLRVSDFAGWLAVRRWAASRLASEGEILLEASPTFRSQVDSIRAVLRKVTL
jgi:REP element-mobilizing transposase RayT